ncbi:MAG TPA: hypothetical protein VMZ03_04810 [Chitinophagaceae bacterium]|nr:hypothetical protein [Chitinophagaceae bacterium]
MQISTDTGPYKDSSIDQIYDMIFCDRPELFQSGNDQEPPFNIIFSERPTVAALQQITDDDHSDPRIKLLAYRKQMALGYSILKKELIGVVVEIGLVGGLDVLACYKNGTARYINHTGSLLIWETPEDEKSYKLIQELFNKSATIVNQIGPWEHPRKQYPSTGNTRMSFLLSDGLYFGEAPTNYFFNDPVAGPALTNATAILQYITERSLEKSKA